MTRSPPVSGTTTKEYHDIPIEDSSLERFGWTRFELPMNGNANARMVVKNDNPAKIIYCIFYRSDPPDTTIKSLKEALAAPEYTDLISETEANSLVTVCLNEFLILQQDRDSKFFKPRYGNNGEAAKSNDEEERLAAENRLTTQDIESAINAIKKEAQYDELSIKQLFYGMASAFTKVPISHIVNSKESGSGCWVHKCWMLYQKTC